MSIGKIFYKVFGEDLFEKYNDEKSRLQSEDQPTCSKNPKSGPQPHVPKTVIEPSLTE